MGWYSTAVAPPPPTCITSARWPSRFLPCRRRGRCCWRLGGRQERRERKPFRKISGIKGTGPGFQRPSGSGHPCHFAAARFVLQSSQPSQPSKNIPTCPVISWARAGPSRPGGCWSTTQRSYLMTIAPPLEALYFLPLPEVRGRLVNTSRSLGGGRWCCTSSFSPFYISSSLCALLQPPC